MKRILLAFQFLTIIPVKEMKNVSDKEIGGASVFFPLIGFLQGALFMVSAVLFLKIFPPELANGLLILVIVATSGGLHLDGLADTFDAIALRGDREKKLLVMKDSTIGPVGVIAIVLALLLKFLALNSLIHYSLFTIHYSLFLVSISVLYIFSLVSVWFCNKKFGGMTGDTFGAVSEISEILFLIMAVIWSQNYI